MKPNKLTPGANLRWESSRMMLPEHVSALNNHRVDLLKVDKPELDEQEIEEISRILGQSLEDHIPISISFYRSGFINALNGIVTKLDPMNREITLMDYEEDRHNLKFDQIVNVNVH